MLDTTRNKLTMGILNRLRQKGAPKPTGNQPASALGGEYDQEDTIDGNGTTANAGLTLPNLPSQPSLKKPKKKPAEEEDESDTQPAY